MVTLGVVVLAFILAGIYFYSNSNTSPGNIVDTSNVKVISINAYRFSYTPDVITVKRGESVKIIINDGDTTHGISIPDLNVRGIGSVEFTADKTGTFEFKCPTFCGEGHRTMKGTLVVTD